MSFTQFSERIFNSTFHGSLVKNVNYVSKTVLSALIFNCVRNAIFKRNYPREKCAKFHCIVRCNY